MPRGPARFSTDAIRSELLRRERLILPLQRRRARAAAKVAMLDRALAALGATAGPAPSRNGTADGRTRRRRNKRSLAEALAAVLKGKTMSVKDAADAVRRAGYRTVSKHFYTQVNIALIKSGRFRRVGRGQYRAK